MIRSLKKIIKKTNNKQKIKDHRKVESQTFLKEKDLWIMLMSKRNLIRKKKIKVRKKQRRAVRRRTKEALMTLMMKTNMILGIMLNPKKNRQLLIKKNKSLIQKKLKRKIHLNKKLSQPLMTQMIQTLVQIQTGRVLLIKRRVLNRNRISKKILIQKRRRNRMMDLLQTMILEMTSTMKMTPLRMKMTSMKRISLKILRQKK